MVNPTAIEKSRQGKRRALDALYLVLTVGEARLGTDTAIASLIRMPKQDVRNLRYDLTETKALEARSVMVGKTKSTSWTLLVTHETARSGLDALWARQDRETAERMATIGERRAKHAAASSTPPTPVAPDETVHISGEDAPKPFVPLGKERFDEPRALVEAARQFAGLHREVDRRLRELEALGISIDRDSVAKTIKLPRDPRLAAVAEALPYIEQLERSVERLGNQVTDLREKVGNLPELQTRLSRLSSQNERLIAEKLALEGRLRDRPSVPMNGAAHRPAEPVGAPASK